MQLSPIENVRLLVALVLLLMTAHLGGIVAVKLRQPRVVGEIAAGALLGETVLGRLSPSAERWIFHEGGVVPVVLAALSQLGLLLLMFASGVDFRASSEPAVRRTTVSIGLFGTALPFLVGGAFASTLDTANLLGPAGSRVAFVLLVGVATSVTGIPVLSRMMLDLGILQTRFARIVLRAAVIEDLALYAVLAVVLALVQSQTEPFGLEAPLARLLASHVPHFSAYYHSASSVLFFALALYLGPRLFRLLERAGLLFLHRANAVGRELIFLLLAVIVALVVGVAPMFGAFLAGVVVGQASDESVERRAMGEARDVIKAFAFGLFVPVYFGMVVLRLDLVREIDAPFCALLVVVATLAKLIGVFVGARLGGEPTRSAVDFAMTMNVRGSMGVVLASVAAGAGVISSRFSVSLIVMALVTTMFGGAWLERATRHWGVNARR